MLSCRDVAVDGIKRVFTRHTDPGRRPRLSRAVVGARARPEAFSRWDISCRGGEISSTVVIFGWRQKSSRASGPVVVHEGRSPLDDLRAMTHVGILAVHGSFPCLRRSCAPVPRSRSTARRFAAATRALVPARRLVVVESRFREGQAPGRGRFFKRPARGDGGDSGTVVAWPPEAKRCC